VAWQGANNRAATSWRSGDAPLTDAAASARPLATLKARARDYTPATPT
jgi:hypothetical protein